MDIDSEDYVLDELKDSEDEKKAKLQAAKQKIGGSRVNGSFVRGSVSGSGKQIQNRLMAMKGARSG